MLIFYSRRSATKIHDLGRFWVSREVLVTEPDLFWVSGARGMNLMIGCEFPLEVVRHRRNLRKDLIQLF